MNELIHRLTVLKHFIHITTIELSHSSLNMNMKIHIDISILKMNQ